jgi:hypothetical protein
MKDLSRAERFRRLQELVERPPGQRPRRYGWTKEELLAEIQRVAKLLGKTPTGQEFLRHAAVSLVPIASYFGTFTKAVKQAGLPPAVPHLTKGELIAEIQRIANIIGRTPRMRDFDALDAQTAVSASTVIQRFGTWNNAIRAAGLKPILVHGHTKEEILKEIRRVAKKIGRVPMVSDFDGHSTIGMWVVTERFGTWNNALVQAGLKPGFKRGWTKKELIQEIRWVAKKLGRTPTNREFNAHSTSCVVTVRNRFGTWDRAIKAAGLEPLHVAFTKSDCLKELQRIAQMLGKTPRMEDFTKHASMNACTVCEFFGSWNNGLQAAGLKPAREKKVIR